MTPILAVAASGSETPVASFKIKMPGTFRRPCQAPGLRLVPVLALVAWSVAAPSAAQRTGDAPFVEPDVLLDESAAPDSVVVTLVAAPARLSLLPDLETAAYAYNGSIPGPTLEVHEGDHVVVRFRNELPEETTVHWHGLHLPFMADGSPFHPVEPGQSFEYAFTVPWGTAGTYLYHPHPNHRTAWQVGMGLYGAIVVRARDDPLEAFPERLLILADNRFLPDGTLDFPDPESERGRLDELNGREGDVLFVNGQVDPVVPIRSGEVQRWRVLNASAARVYRISLADHQLLHVGTDGGLFERPAPIDELVLANTERSELLVRGTAGRGERASLSTLPYDRYMPRGRPDDWEEPRRLLTLSYGPDPPVEAPPIPTRLRHVPRMDPRNATATRLIRMSQGRLNSRLMDMERMDVTAPLGATEIWEIRNLVGMDHPFHLHGFRFQVLDRNGVPEPFPSWKDTVNVPRRETVRFIVRYDEHPGLWMFHCHILEHEDQGMMGILEVR